MATVATVRDLDSSADLDGMNRSSRPRRRVLDDSFDDLDDLLEEMPSDFEDPALGELDDPYEGADGLDDLDDFEGSCALDDFAGDPYDDEQQEDQHAEEEDEEEDGEGQRGLSAAASGEHTAGAGVIGGFDLAAIAAEFEESVRNPAPERPTISLPSRQERRARESGQRSAESRVVPQGADLGEGSAVRIGVT